MKFKIEEVEYEPSAKLPRAVLHAAKILLGLPDGTLLRSRSLAARVGISDRVFAHYMAHPALKDFKEKENTGCLWGSRETIGQLRRMKNAHQKESPIVGQS